MHFIHKKKRKKKKKKKRKENKETFFFGPLGVALQEEEPWRGRGREKKTFIRLLLRQITRGSLKKKINR